MESSVNNKAPYAPPVLVRYGSFAVLTQGYVGNGSERGMSGTSMKKNTPGHY